MTLDLSIWSRCIAPADTRYCRKFYDLKAECRAAGSAWCSAGQHRTNRHRTLNHFVSFSSTLSPAQTAVRTLETPGRLKHLQKHTHPTSKPEGSSVCLERKAWPRSTSAQRAVDAADGDLGAPPEILWSAERSSTDCEFPLRSISVLLDTR